MNEDFPDLSGGMKEHLHYWRKWDGSKVIM